MDPGRGPGVGPGALLGAVLGGLRSVATRVSRVWSALVDRGRLEREMSEEMAHHLELEVEDRVRGGMTPAEARRTALRDFGGVERWKEEARASRGVAPWDALRQDLRYARRSLAGSPGFAAVAVVTLALGIGATTAVFSVVDGLLLKPLGYGSPERIVRILEYHDDGSGRGTIAQANYFDWMDAATTLDAGALYDEYRPTLRLEDGALKVGAASVGAEYFEVLGLRPQVGRFFLPEEAEANSQRVVLSDGLWREAFGADPGVVGRVLDLNGFPYTVVGVAPPFEDPGLSGSAGTPRLWRSPPGYFYTNGRGGRSFTAVARLAPGVELEAARTELSTIHARLAERYPETNTGYVLRLVPLKDDLVGDAAPVLWLLLGAVGLVLLIACANVANLLLFRAAGRGREIALRSAIGASRGRIVRQLLVESLLLGLAGAAAGVAVAWVAMWGVLALAGDLPRVESVGLDPRVLAFALAAALLATLVFGLLPALHTARPDAAEALKEGGRGSSGSRGQGRLRSLVVASQVALAVVVMLGAGLLGRSLLRLQAVDPGVAADRALALRLDPPYDPYDPSTVEGAEASRSLYAGLAERIKRVPGVEAMGVTDLLPMSGSFNGNSFHIEGRPEARPGDEPSAETRAVDAAYLDVMGIPVIDGRGIRRDDGPDSRRVAVVNQAFVREYFPGESPLGRGMRIMDPDAPPAEIVGVVGDVTQFSLEEAPGPTVYLPREQAPVWMQDEPWLVVRTTRAPAALAASVRSAIREVDPRIPVYDVAPMADIIDRTLARPRFRTLLLLAFAGLAFVLSAIGVYGMVSYTVARRLPELGVRMALGATAAQLRRLVVGQGLRPVLVGAAVGLAVGLVAVRLLATFLYGVSPTDPVTFLAAPAALAAVAAVAAWLPARRASRVSPSRVLREE